jgi:DNA replication and repair protein RecF
MVERLDKACAAAEHGPFPSPALGLSGELETWLNEFPALEAETRYRATLAANRKLDARAGRAAIGAHRSELTARYRERDMPAALCSTGEQKALLIALVLSNAALMVETAGHKPILLLDEITAHLDPSRRAALLTRISAMELQAWVSGTEPDSFAMLLPSAARFSVIDGQVMQLPDLVENIHTIRKEADE